MFLPRELMNEHILYYAMLTWQIFRITLFHAERNLFVKINENENFFE